MNKKGFIRHPFFLFLFGVILGIVLAILWARGTIPISFPFCPAGG